MREGQHMMFIRKLSRKLFPDKPASTNNRNFHISATTMILLTPKRSNLTLAFSCGARSAPKLKRNDYLRNMLSCRQLQGFVGFRHVR
jgi:hypothetical protein